MMVNVERGLWSPLLSYLLHMTNIFSGTPLVYDVRILPCVPGAHAKIRALVRQVGNYIAIYA